MTVGPTERPTLQGRLVARLFLITGLVVLGNLGFVAFYDAADRGSLHQDLAQREVRRLETALVRTGSDGTRLLANPGAIYLDHPEAYALALIRDDGSVIGGRNMALIPPDMLRPGPFATDWMAWPNGQGVLPVLATHSVAGSDPPVSVVFYMVSDPAHLMAAEVWDEFRGHVWLPLLPIAILLIGGTLLIVRGALRPVAVAAAWAREIEPGRKVPTLVQSDAPAEIYDLTEAVQRSIARLDAELVAEQRRAAEAAHALRTPVAVLVARLDSLPDDQPSNAIRDDVRALSRMVTQFLSSAGADRLEVDRDARADLNAIAARVVADLAPFADTKGSEIELQSDDRPVIVCGQDDAIALALTNLIENAVIHGGGQITVRVGPGPELSVTDTGPGLPDSSEALFEPFRRGAGAVRGGAGLGLAIVTRIQRAHGGAVRVATTPGAGTVFRLVYRAV